MNEVMQKHHLALIASVCWLGFVSTVQAGAWSIVQETTIGTTKIEQVQSGSAANAVQAINHINLEGGDTLNFATQTVSGNSKPVTFTQEGSSSGSVQALNHTATDSISSTIFQNASTFGNVSFEQKDTTSNNTQAINSIKTTGNVTGVTQLVNTSSPVSFSQNSSGSSNVQAVNVVDANTSGSAITLGSTSQQAFLTGGVTFDGTSPTLQAVNALLIPAGTGTSSSNQTTLATSVNINGTIAGFTNTTATSSTPPQVLNFIGARP